MPVWARTVEPGLLSRWPPKDSLLVPVVAWTVLPLEGASAREDPSAVRSDSVLAGKMLAQVVLPRLLLPL